MFTLNFGTIYLFDFLFCLIFILVENVRNDERLKKLVYIDEIYIGNHEIYSPYQEGI